MVQLPKGGLHGSCAIYQIHQYIHHGLLPTTQNTGHVFRPIKNQGHLGFPKKISCSFSIHGNLLAPSHHQPLASGFARARAKLLYFRRPMERPKELVRAFASVQRGGKRCPYKRHTFPNGDGKIAVSLVSFSNYIVLHLNLNLHLLVFFFRFSVSILVIRYDKIW